VENLVAGEGTTSIRQDGYIIRSCAIDCEESREGPDGTERTIASLRNKDVNQPPLGQLTLLRRQPKDKTNAND